MTHDIFVSYKREDERLAARLAKALEAEGFRVWWDRRLLPAQSWREQIQAALDAASVVIVVWTEESTGAHGDFVRDEAAQAKARGRLVPVMMERTSLPLGFGELQAIDLIGWRGSTRNPFFRDLVATVRARMEGVDPPKPKGPMRRALRRASAGVVSMGALGLVVAFSGNVMSVQQHTCSVAMAQPTLSDVCGALGLGGMPSRAERLAWQAREPGNCAALRSHVERFPDGAYRSTAADLIAARRETEDEVWTRAERRLRLALIPGQGLHPSETAARTAAEAEALAEARTLCAGFANTQSYRVLSAAPQLEELDCDTYSRGVTCSGRGEAVCAVEVRETIRTERCGAPP